MGQPRTSPAASGTVTVTSIHLLEVEPIERGGKVFLCRVMVGEMANGDWKSLRRSCIVPQRSPLSTESGLKWEVHKANRYPAWSPGPLHSLAGRRSRSRSEHSSASCRLVHGKHNTERLFTEFPKE
ncbi:hypothetical protein J6590_044678 [Homalodisca vitripennis]|nr:hypothetical protein J6590_044678 [Homalodisca vitripennis]